MFFDKIVNAFKGGAESVAKDASNFLRNALNDHERFAGHNSLWKLSDSIDRVSGVLSTTWMLDAKALRQRFFAGSNTDSEFSKLLERIKNGVRMLAKLRHPGIVRVVSPLHEHKNGDLSFVTERVTCSLVERMQQLKQSRNTDQWTDVGDFSSSSGGGGSSSQQQHQHHHHVTPQQHQQKQQVSIDEALFGPPSAAPAAAATSTSTTTPTPGSNFCPSESSMNMDALDEAEILLLLRGIAEGLHFLHSAAKLVHLNVAPEAICVVRGTDEDLRLGAAGGNRKDVGAVGKAGQFKEHWKICDLSFVCALADLDTLPGKHCDHFTQIGGVRSIVKGGGSSSSSNNNNRGNVFDPFSSSPPRATVSSHHHDASGSALVNSLVCPVLDFAAPEYVLQNKPSIRSDIFSFAQLAFAVLRVAADPQAVTDSLSVVNSLPISIAANNDIAAYQECLGKIGGGGGGSWDSGSSAWTSAVQPDQNRRLGSLEDLLKSADTLGGAAPVALEKSAGLQFMDHEGRLQCFFQLHRALPLMANGTLLRRVFPTLASVADAAKPDLHRYIAPLAISAAATVGMHLSIFTGRGAAGPAVGDALAVVVHVFRVLFRSSDVHAAIVMLEEHAKLAPALPAIDDFTRQESSFLGGPTPGWISSFQDRTRDLTRAYVEMISKAVRCDNVSIATPGVAAAAAVLRRLSCGSAHELTGPANISADAMVARREDVAAAELLLPALAAHAFGNAPCNVGEETRNIAADTTSVFVKSVIEDRKKLQAMGLHAFSSQVESDHPPHPLQVSVERRCTAVREHLFAMLLKMQAQIHNCSTLQQQRWVGMIASAGKLIRPQDVAAQVLGILGNALIDSRLPMEVAQLAAKELKDFTEYLIGCRKLK